MTRPNPFRSRQRQALTDRYMPAWTAGAACARKTTVSGMPWESAFLDDVAHKPEGDYEWPDAIKTVMEVCAGCPVRAECLAYGFAGERPLKFGDVHLYVSHLVDCDDMACEGCIPEGERIHTLVDFTLERLPAGVYGGLPGPMRERFRAFPDRLQRGEAWFVDLARGRGWMPPATVGEAVGA